MSQYQVTIQIDSDTRVDRLRDTLDRIVLHTFGSSGEVVNFVEIDNDADPEEWQPPASGISDDWKTATPHLGHPDMHAPKPRISTGWETIRMRRYRGKSGVYYQSENDAAYAFDLEED